MGIFCVINGGSYLAYSGSVHCNLWSLMAALDGQLKHEDTNLASSTLIPDQTTKENLGIIVQYKVRPEDITV